MSEQTPLQAGLDLIDLLEDSDARVTADEIIPVLMELCGAVEERQWQPIETAPKDGPPLLLLKDRERFVACYLRGEHGWGWCTPDGYEILRPTHWMPLPAAPQDFINDRIEKGRR